MSSTLTQSPVAPADLANTSTLPIQNSPPSIVSSPDSSYSPESRVRLEALLSADVVELRCVCDEIRSLPQLESLIVRLTAPSIAVAGAAQATLEESIVLLGTDHLRALVQAWSRMPPGPSSESAVTPLLEPVAPAAWRETSVPPSRRFPRR